MDYVIAPITSSVLLDNDFRDFTDTLTQSLVQHDHQPDVVSSVTRTALQELHQTDLVDVLCDDPTRLVTPLISSSLSVVVGEREKQSVVERGVLFTSPAVAYSLPSIMSLSSFTASSLENNNVSINCSFTNSSIDSRDDDVGGLHVTFDDDNRPQLRPKNENRRSTGFEILKAVCPNEKLSTLRVSCPAADQTPDCVAASSSLQVVSETTSNTSSTLQVVSRVTCDMLNADQSSCPTRTLSSITSEDLCADGSRESSAAAASSISTVVNVLAQKEINSANGESVESEQEEGQTESSSGRDQTNAQEVTTTVDHGVVSDEKNVAVSNFNHVPAPDVTDEPEASSSSEKNVAVSNFNHVPAPDVTDEPEASSSSVRNKRLSMSPTPVGKSGRTHKNRNSNPSDQGVEPCCPTNKSSPTAPATPVRKSVRTHRNPLNTSEFVSLDISPRSRAKAAASKRLSLDSGSSSTITQHTSSGTKATQLHTSKPRKEPPRIKKRGSSTVETERRIDSEQQNLEKCSLSEQLPVKPDPKTTNSLNYGVSAEPGEVKRKRGRPRKNQAAVNGKTGIRCEAVQLAAGSSWSSLNSKAAGDSSLGSIGLVSELFSVTPFTPVSANFLLPTTSESLVSKESSTQPVQKSDNQVLPSKSQSPVADLSFALDELSSIEQKHKRKKKKKKRKKSRHASLADNDEDVSKVSGNVDDLVGALQSLQMSSSEIIHQPPEQSEPSASFAGSHVLAKIFSKSFYNQNLASCQRSFVVRGKTLGWTGSNLSASVVGNRSRTGRKASPLLSNVSRTETRQSCLPPKKRHRLQMSHNVSQTSDFSKTHVVVRGRRGRPPKHRTNEPSQKPHVKTSKYCSKFCFFVALISIAVYQCRYI